MSSLRSLLFTKVLIADGGMGTSLQQFDLTLEDFDGYEGCNEVLNRTRPDVVEKVHESFLMAGSDMIETNTFGANWAALAEYDIADEIDDLAFRGASIARKSADKFSSNDWPRFVLGSIGPGTKLPSLGQIEFSKIRDAYQIQVEAMIRGGIDAVQIETVQDLLQAKAAIIATKRARKKLNVDLPIFVSVTVETTGTLLMGSEIGAALATLAPLGVDLIGLNCATGPAEMSEHLRHLGRFSPKGISAMPNAGLPELTAQGAVYKLTPDELGAALKTYVDDFGLALIGGCCGTRPDHIEKLRSIFGRSYPVKQRIVEPLSQVASLYSETALKQDSSYLAIGERTNANGSKAFREAMIAGDWTSCLDIAKRQSSSGAHILDLCVDYVGRDGSADMAELASRFNSSVTLPVMLDSTEPQVLETGLKLLAGRAIINSVNFEDSDGPDSRYANTMALVSEYGCAVVALTIDEQGQARTAETKLAIAERLISQITNDWSIAEGDILVDTLTFPIATGTEETRRDGLETINAIRQLKERHPNVLTTLGVSNISFGLNPAARVVLNSVFLDECVKAGLDSAIVSVAKIMPIERIPAEQYQVALDLIYDRRSEGYDPLQKILTMFEGVSTQSVKAQQEAELAALPVTQRLSRRIIDGNDRGLETDLDEALKIKGAIEIINEDLLAGMKTVGDLFGSGQMQLPFVLQAAETMKKAVAYLEPHMDSSNAGAGKGTLVLATVKGDVHDIGKNLVDIIVSNNGYSVVNIGIKQPINAIIEAAEKHNADVIGMSGLLVKSTLVMKDNLLELNSQKLSKKYPVVLGGAALTRTYVDEDLAALYDGTVRYAKDAFEGLTLMDSLMAIKHGDKDAKLPEPRKRRVKPVAKKPEVDQAAIPRSEVTRPIPGSGVDVPQPPFWGSKVVKGISLAEITDWLDERATLMGRWGLRGVKGGASYEELAESQGRPRIRALLDMIKSEGLGQFGVVYGYYPCFSRGNDLVVLDPNDHAKKLFTWSFPRQIRDRHLCIPDFFRDENEAAIYGPDTLAMQLVTMGTKVSEKTAELYEANKYRDYLELHGLCVQLTEALAEMWHHRVRVELGANQLEGPIDRQIAKQEYQGSRYSFGYPACPNLELRQELVNALEPERIGVNLSEEFQLHPEQSTDAIIVHHQQAKYFSA